MPIVPKERDYEFEVAISFLQRDENIAMALYDHISDQYKTFIYTNRQEELVGQDGTEAFRVIYEEKARIVVVFYREEWGSTFWTRVEEQAIKRRSFEESADFTIFVSLDQKKPEWLSKTQLWYDFERFGLKSLVGIISKRVTEYGGHRHEETVIERAARQKRKIARQKEIEGYLDSEEAYEDVKNEIKTLFDIAAKNMSVINDPSLGMHYGSSKVKYEQSGQVQKFTCWGVDTVLSFLWVEGNTLDKSYLRVSLTNNHYGDPFQRSRGDLYNQEDYLFSKNIADSLGWSNKKYKEEFYTTEKLLDFWQKQLINKVEEQKNEDDDYSNDLSNYI